MISGPTANNRLVLPQAASEVREENELIALLHSKAFIAAIFCTAIVCVGLAGCSRAVSSPEQSADANADASDGADLAVAAASVSDESPSAGGKSTLSVTVRNVGARAAAATTLRYYRSNDPTITISDTEVGTGRGSRTITFKEHN